MRISKLNFFLEKIYLAVKGSIAFYPALLSVLMLMLAWFLVYLDTISVGKGILEHLDLLNVENNDTARSLLSSLVGGLISLMVFSFSMVMIVLNQAANNYSPRVLPGLISQREHQVVLGIYLGTIGYTIVVLSHVGSEVFGQEVPRLALLMDILLGFACIIAFVYFIHTISNVVQIGNVLKRLYGQTRGALIRELSSGYYQEEKVVLKNVHVVKSWQSGYLFGLNEKDFLKGAQKYQLEASLLKGQGSYVLKGAPLVAINQARKEEVLQFVKDHFIFRHQEVIETNYYYGFKQITEVAVKALSPGINDPGTAVQAINYLGDLLRMLMRLKGQRVLKGSDGKPVLIYADVPFSKVFYLCVSGIRNYAEKDVAVQVKLIKLIKELEKIDKSGEHRQLFEAELKAIGETAERCLNSSLDVEYIKSILK